MSNGLIQLVAGVGFSVAVVSLVMIWLGIRLLIKFSEWLKEFMIDDRVQRTETIKAYFTVMKGMADSATRHANHATEAAEDLKANTAREIAVAKAEVKEDLKSGTAPHGALPIVAIFVLFSFGHLFAIHAPEAQMRSVNQMESELQVVWRAGNHEGAERLIGEIADAGHKKDSPLAAHVEGLMLEREGDNDGACAAYRENHDYPASAARLKRLSP